MCWRRCAFCEYSEPCQWSLRKHFRLKHPGTALKVREYRDAHKDARVEQTVEECAIQLRQAGEELAAEADTSTWKAPGELAQRGMRKRAGVVERAPPQIHADSEQTQQPAPPTGQDTVMW